MVRSHARNNTTQSTLTYYERSLLRKDSTSKRLGGDSFKPLDSCNLCLSKSTDPCSCPQGHIYCRECILSDLLTQKAGIESQKREMERWDENERQERAEAVRKARERVVSDFERGMGLGLGVGSSGKKGVMDDNLSSGVGSGSRVDDGSGSGIGGAGSGGMINFDGDIVERTAREAEEKAMRVIEKEQAEARKSKLAAFWLPSLTPDAKIGPLKDIKLQTLCQAGGNPHPISRKTLHPVLLTYPTPTSKNPTCPSCTKELHNAVPAILLSSRTPATSPDIEPRKKKMKKDKEDPLVCGHVVCKTCADTIVKAGGRCCVCEAEIGEGGRIPFGKEGTGFAAAGGAEVKKQTIAFRV